MEEEFDMDWGEIEERLLSLIQPFGLPTDQRKGLLEAFRNLTCQVYTQGGRVGMEGRNQREKISQTIKARKTYTTALMAHDSRACPDDVDIRLWQAERASLEFIIEALTTEIREEPGYRLHLDLLAILSDFESDLSSNGGRIGRLLSQLGAALARYERAVFPGPIQTKICA